MTQTINPPKTERSKDAARHIAGIDPWAPVVPLALDAIVPNPANPRRHFDEAALDELAASLRTDGLLEPIVVREIALTGRYEIIAGERRWRAAQRAGLAELPARILENIDDHTALRLALVENLQRRDLDPIEEAQGYRALHDVVGLKQAEIAAAVKRGQPAIAKALGLLDLPDDVQELIRTRHLTPAHGAALLRYKKWPALCSAIAANAAKSGRTSKALEGPLDDLYLYQSRKLLQILYSPYDDCKQCPYDARRREGGYQVCLHPAHFEELHQREQEALKERVRAAAGLADGDPVSSGSANGRAQGEIPKLADLPGDSYELVAGWGGRGTAPEGCTPECPCRAQAIGYGETVPAPICLDPARFRSLKEAAATKQAREVDRLCAEDLAALEAYMDTVALGPDLVAIIADRAMRWGMDEGPLRAAVKRHAPQLYSEKLKELTEEQLATIPMEAQVKLLVEALVRVDIEHRRKYPHNGLDVYVRYARFRERWITSETQAAITTTDVVTCDGCGRELTPQTAVFEDDVAYCPVCDGVAPDTDAGSAETEPATADTVEVAR